MIALRRSHPVFRRRDFFAGQAIHGSDAKDIHWLKPDGTEMSDHEWSHDFARCLGVYLSGASLTETDTRGRRLYDDDFLILFSAHHEALEFMLPPTSDGTRWFPLLDTAREDGVPELPSIEPGAPYLLRSRSLVLLLHVIAR